MNAGARLEPGPERGHLAETSLPRLLVELHRRRFDGALELTRERSVKRFVLSDGAPVSGDSNLPSDRLTARLAEAGRLGAGERRRVEDRARQSGAPEARVLLELRLLDARQLVAAIRDQVRRSLMDCFAWPDGDYALEAAQTPPDDAAALRVDLLPLVQEGIASRWSPERVLQDLGPRMNARPLRSDRLARVVERLEPEPEVRALLERLDGRHTLWQVLQAAPGPRALATAWLLDALQALRYADAAGPAPAERSEIELVVVRDRPRPVRQQRTRVERGRGRDAAAARRIQALHQEVQQTFARLDDLDHYQILGLEPAADTAAVKRAYLKAARTYHPDALARSGLEPEVRTQASRIFAAIGRAYATLTDPGRRREYDRSLGGDDSALDAERLANAETLFRKGEVLLRLGNFAGALEFLQPAVELWPGEADYQNALGWALYKKLPSEPEAAREHLEQAAELAPGDDVVAFRLGAVRRALGEASG